MGFCERDLWKTNLPFSILYLRVEKPKGHCLKRPLNWTGPILHSRQTLLLQGYWRRHCWKSPPNPLNPHRSSNLDPVKTKCTLWPNRLTPPIALWGIAIPYRTHLSSIAMYCAMLPKVALYRKHRGGETSGIAAQAAFWRVSLHRGVS